MLKNRFKASLILLIAGLFSCKREIQKKQNKVEEVGTSYHEKYMEEILTIVPKSKVTTVDNMVLIKGGEFLMGATTQQARADEYPVHSEKVNDFYMDVDEVTNAEFKAFVKATDYITTAERIIDVNHIAVQSQVRKTTL